MKELEKIKVWIGVKLLLEIKQTEKLIVLFSMILDVKS